jgi:hypothetical protein
MRRTLAALALGSCALIGTATAASAQSKPCDAYSGACVKGVKHVKPPQVEGNSSGLPFTGAQVTGLLAAGTAAVAGGTVLVVAGRKRRTSPATA